MGKRTALQVFMVASSGLFALPIGAEAAETTLRIATVDNPDTVRMQELSRAFEEANPDITLEWNVLDENTLRQRVITDIATGAGQFDVVTIGTYEAPIWADREWLEPIEDMPGQYDVDDILPSIRNALSIDGTLYAAPFYGESAFTMYRTDLFEAADLEMPREPTWDFIRKAAQTLSEQNDDLHALCLRGKAGWGENVAMVTVMANAHGARWFDEDWQPTLDGDAWSTTLDEYVSLLNDYGPPDAVENGYNETLSLFQEGQCGIWVDATVAASALTDPERSSVADKVGFALAPGTGLETRSDWLWAWALAIPSATENIDAAKRLVAWATSSTYTELVAEKDGWANVPPGTRASLYENERYRKAAPFADIVLEAIEGADPSEPTVDQVPYRGMQFVAHPAFQTIGTAVGNRFARALDGSISTEEALENAQWVTEKVIEQARAAED